MSRQAPADRTPTRGAGARARALSARLLRAMRRWIGEGARTGGRRLELHLGGQQRTQVIVLLAGVLALSSADTATVGASATQLRSALHISNTDIGLLVAVNAAVAAVASIPFGYVADRLNRTRVLAGAVFLWGAAMLWSATVSSFDRLLLARLALGLVTAVAGPVVASLIGDYFPSTERGRIYGYVLSGELLGAGFGFAVTGDIAALSWRLAFVILAIPTFILARFLLRLPEPIRGGLAPLQPVVPSGPAGPGGTRAPGRGRRSTVATAGGTALPTPVGLPDETDRTMVFPASTGGSGRGHTDPSGRLDPRFPYPGYTRSPASAIPETPGAPPTAWPPTSGDDAEDDGAPKATDAQRLAQEQGINANADRAELLATPSGLVATMRHLLAIKTNTILIISSALGYFYLAGIETFALEFTKEQYGINQALASLLLLVVGAGAVVGVLVSGPLSDRMLERGRLNARIATPAVMAAATVVLFIPALVTRSATTALPYVALAALALSAQNPPIDAARLDIVPSPLWGRAEGLRTALRTAAQSLAPLVFGGLSDLFGGHRGGLQFAFLLTLLPLAGSAYFLFRAMRTYPSDVATAAAASMAVAARQRRARTEEGNDGTPTGTPAPTTRVRNAGVGGRFDDEQPWPLPSARPLAAPAAPGGPPGPAGDLEADDPDLPWPLPPAPRSRPAPPWPEEPPSPGPRSGVGNWPQPRETRPGPGWRQADPEPSPGPAPAPDPDPDPENDPDWRPPGRDQPHWY